MSNVLPNDARQYSLSAFITFDFEDIPGAVVIVLAKIPTGSVITSGLVFVEIDFAGGTTHDCDIGDNDNDDRYSPTIIELDGGAGIPSNTFTVDESKTAIDDEDLTLTPIHTGGDPTSGVARCVIEYVTDGRGNENRG